MRTVPVSAVKTGMTLRQTIYSGNQVLLREGASLTPAYIRRLKELGYSTIRIGDPLSDDIEPETTISDHQHHEGVQAVEQISRALQSSSQRERLVRDPRVFEAVIGYVERLIQTLNKGGIRLGLNSLKSHSSYTFQHSVDVAVAAVLLGRRMGLPEAHLENLGLGAILHDIGKAFIPTEILEKPGKLTDEEFDHIKEHPRLGYDALCMNAKMKLRARVTNIALYHHERHGGGGYPDNLRGDDQVWNPFDRDQDIRGIHPMTQMVSICDVFDALTSDRPYREGMCIPDAVRLMTERMPDMFHPVYLRRFLECLNLYPVGATVRIASGEYRDYIGTVVKSDKDDFQNYSARVRLFFDNERNQLEAPLETDIQDNPVSG